MNRGAPSPRQDAFAIIFLAELFTDDERRVARNHLDQDGYGPR